MLLLLATALIAAAAEEESCEAGANTCTEGQSIAIKRKSLSESRAPINEDIHPTKYRPVEEAPQHTQFWVSLINDRNEQVEAFWNDGTEQGQHQGLIEPLSSIKVGTYNGHTFFIRLPGQTEKLATFEMDRDVEKYVLHVPEEQKRLEAEAVKKEREFRKEYREKTGKEWAAFYPRNPPKLYIYPVEEVGQIFEAKTDHAHYHCYPETTDAKDVAKCRDSEPITFELNVHAVSPKVMSISNFLSDFECDHIIELAKPRLKRSTIGDGENIEVSYTRTSTSTFLNRKESEILDWIHRRIADVMKLPESHLWKQVGCEDLQVLHYGVGQQFYDHPDYAITSPNMRYLTFLMYLNDVEEGGQTAFRSIDLEVFPKKRDVAIFYSITEDGNADVGSIHAGRPVKKGEKWAAPLWIWDPSR
eukprot:200867_1